MKIPSSIVIWKVTMIIWITSFILFIIGEVYVYGVTVTELIVGMLGTAIWLLPIYGVYKLKNTKHVRLYQISWALCVFLIVVTIVNTIWVLVTL